MDGLLADETILRIFSYLDARELTRLQLVNAHFRTLAKDRHLWKRLFYFTFVRPVDSASGGPATPTSLPTLRELKSLLLHQNLPSRKHVAGDGDRHIKNIPRRFYDTSATSASQEQAERALSLLFMDGGRVKENAHDTLLDWEHLFRVSTNWQSGNFAVSQLIAPGAGVSQPLAHDMAQPLPLLHQHTIVRVSDQFIFTASPSDCLHAASAPSISVYASDSASSHACRLEFAAEHIPNDLQERSPILRFSSPALQKLLTQGSLDGASNHVAITEIAVDAALLVNSPVADAVSRSKRTSAGKHEPANCPISRIVVTYSTGQISLFSLRTTDGAQGTIEASEEVFHSPRANGTFGSPDYVSIAALHSPALVLCSSKFDVAFYQIGTSSSGLTQLHLVQHMSSYRCSSPAALRLKKLPYHDVSKRARRASSSSSPERGKPREQVNEAAFRVTLAYSTPSYPSSWSVSVQELVVRINLEMPWAPPIRVDSRHATAKLPFRSTPIDLRGRSMLAGRSLSPAFPPGSASHSVPESMTTSLTYDDPFLVVGASDNLVEVYELLGATTHVRRHVDAAPAPAPRSATATPLWRGDALRLMHRHSLYGHTGSVHSVALEDGRCVSGSADGSVMVWSLGDRSNDTDSIASILRNTRAPPRGTTRAADRGRGLGARSSSSTILEDEDGEEAASHMSHVLTLRLPSNVENEHPRRPLTHVQHSSQKGLARSRRLSPSLGQLVRSRVLDQQARGIVRWVSTAFDKIVSIVVYTDAAPNPERVCTSTLHEQHTREKVQIWSFG